MLKVLEILRWIWQLFVRLQPVIFSFGKLLWQLFIRLQPVVLSFGKLMWQLFVRLRPIVFSFAKEQYSTWIKQAQPVDREVSVTPEPENLHLSEPLSLCLKQNSDLAAPIADHSASSQESSFLIPVSENQTKGSLAQESLSGTELTALQSASFQKPSFVIPAPASQAKSSSAQEESLPSLGLNMELIDIKRAESAAVATILGDIFAEDEPFLVPIPPLSVETSIAGLDATHFKLIKALSEQPCWSRDELQPVVEKLGLMLDGALETINEVAFDHFEEPLTEGEDPIEVNSQVLEEILS
jgi:hypothetical protein